MLLPQNIFILPTQDKRALIHGVMLKQFMCLTGMEILYKK